MGAESKSFYREIVKALFILQLWQVAWLEDLSYMGEKDPQHWKSTRCDMLNKFGAFENLCFYGIK